MRAAFDFTRLLGSGLDNADEATLCAAADELRRRIAAGNPNLTEVLQQVEDRLENKRAKRLHEDRHGHRGGRED
jgi:hypothetical protein